MPFVVYSAGAEPAQVSGWGRCPWCGHCGYTVYVGEFDHTVCLFCYSQVTDYISSRAMRINQLRYNFNYYNNVHHILASPVVQCRLILFLRSPFDGYPEWSPLTRDPDLYTEYLYQHDLAIARGVRNRQFYGGHCHWCSWWGPNYGRKRYVRWYCQHEVYYCLGCCYHYDNVLSGNFRHVQIQ